MLLAFFMLVDVVMVMRAVIVAVVGAAAVFTCGLSVYTVWIWSWSACRLARRDGDKKQCWLCSGRSSSSSNTSSASDHGSSTSCDVGS